MARISLRAYNRDIEAMIDKNQIDEAFAHCRYILELYPKHVDTYRLMGKALLEAQRFSDAADVFHRVLSSVPDDFISHLGMSIIREDESNLDAAIWHMERSFEVQPSNAAVQVELRRLYGLRDGITPQKIQLTRGGLARMSAKSNLHSQAIAELRAALSNDPQRPDLQVVLAEMYRQTGARMEAIETCNSLINKLPYCLVANRIMAEVLPETERAEQAHEYKTRVGELDPYFLQLSPVAPTLEQVPDGAVTIERLEYDGESYATVEEAQPAWAASLGVDLDEEETETEESAPDWLQEEESASKTAPQMEQEVEPEIFEEEIHLGLSDEEDAAEQADLPDWMSEAGEAEDTPSFAGAAAVAGAAALGASLTGEDSEETEEEPFSAPEAGMEMEQDFAPQQEAAQEVEITGEGETAVEEEPDIMAGEEAETRDEEQLPDWMQEAEEEDSGSLAGAAAAAGAAALGAGLISEDEEDSEPEFDQAPAPEDLQTLPDWMAEIGAADTIPSKELGAAADQASAEEPQEGDLQLGASGEGEPTPDWMEEAEAGSEVETPDWLREAMEGTEESGPGAGAVAAAAGAALIPDSDSEEYEFESMEGIEAETAPPSGVDAEDVVSEDEGDLDQAAGEDESDLEVATAIGAAAVVGSALSGDDEAVEDERIDEDIPDWLQDLGEDLPAGEAGPEKVVLFEEPSPGEEGIPLSDSQSEIAEEFEVEPEGEFAPGIISEISEEDEFPESIPDWLSEVSPEEIPQEVAEAEGDIDIVRAEIPVWLRKMEAQHKAEMESVESIEDLELDAEFTELSGEDVPTWLMSAMEPELVSPAGEPMEVDDIGELFETEEPVAIDEIGLGSAADGTGEAETEGQTEHALEEDEAAEPLVEAAEPAKETEPLEEAAEEVEFDAMQEEISARAAASEAEIETGEEDFVEMESSPAEIDEVVEIPPQAELVKEREEEPGGIDLPGLAAGAAAGVAAAQLFDQEDTQPVALTSGPESPEEIDAAAEIAEGEEGMDAGVLEEEAGVVEEDILYLEEIEESAAPALAADAPLSGEDEDAAMAWLESLAARQGAAEEELLTSADERQEAPPDWVQEEAAQFAETEEEQDDERDKALTAAALAGVTAGILAAQDESEEPEDVDLEAALEAEPASGTEELPEQPSEWVPEIIADEQELEMEEAAEGEAIEAEMPDITGEPDVEEELAEAAEIDLEEIEEVEPPEEIPDWLSDLAEDQEETGAETVEWTPAMLSEEEGEIPLAAPPEKIDLNAASLAQLEKIPGVGFIHAQNIVNYRSENGSFTSLDQLAEVEGLNADMVADLEEYLAVEVVSEATAPQPEITELQDAWSDISAGNIESALDRYSELINQDQHLDEIIEELQAAIGKYPGDSSLYQSLGDAYMHANMLQEALDAYNRAEDLI